MASQTTPSNIFTFEQLMELFRETDRRMEETHRQIMEDADRRMEESERRMKEEADRRMKEADRRMEETNRQMKEEADRRMEEANQRMKETDRVLQESIREMRMSTKQMNKKLAEFGDRIGELVAAMVEGGIVRKFNELGYSFTTCATRGHEFENRELGVSGEFDLFLEDVTEALGAEVKTKLSISDVKEHIKRMDKYRKFADARNDKRRFFAAVGGGVVRKEVQDFAMKNGIYVIVQSGDSVEIAPLPKEFKARAW